MTGREAKPCGACECAGLVVEYVETYRGRNGVIEEITCERTCPACDGSMVARCDYCGDAEGSEWIGNDWSCAGCAEESA